MTAVLVIAGLLVAAPALAAAATAGPTPEQLSEALGGGGTHVTSLHCEASGASVLRCTYLQWTQQGYTRWAVLVSERAGRWTISEGPIRDKTRQVFRR